MVTSSVAIWMCSSKATCINHINTGWSPCPIIPSLQACGNNYSQATLLNQLSLYGTSDYVSGKLIELPQIRNRLCDPAYHLIAIGHRIEFSGRIFVASVHISLRCCQCHGCCQHQRTWKLTEKVSDFVCVFLCISWYGCKSLLYFQQLLVVDLLLLGIIQLWLYYSNLELQTHMVAEEFEQMIGFEDCDFLLQLGFLCRVATYLPDWCCQSRVLCDLQQSVLTVGIIVFHLLEPEVDFFKYHQFSDPFHIRPGHQCQVTMGMLGFCHQCASRTSASFKYTGQHLKMLVSQVAQQWREHILIWLLLLLPEHVHKLKGSPNSCVHDNHNIHPDHGKWNQPKCGPKYMVDCCPNTGLSIFIPLPASITAVLYTIQHKETSHC